MNIYDEIVTQLTAAIKAARMESSSFGFPNDRIEIKSVHFGDDVKGHIGDVLHPTEYIRRITRLHHESWIIHPLKSVIELLEIQRASIDNAERIVGLLKDKPDLADQLEKLVQACKGGAR